jgi:hypothetical protein
LAIETQFHCHPHRSLVIIPAELLLFQNISTDVIFLQKYKMDVMTLFSMVIIGRINLVMWSYSWTFSVCWPLLLLLLFLTYALQRSRLIVRSGLDVPPRENTQRRKVELWARNVRKFSLNADFHVTFRDLLHAVMPRHGTDGFTSPPKEGMLRIFSP